MIIKIDQFSFLFSSGGVSILVAGHGLMESSQTIVGLPKCPMPHLAFISMPGITRLAWTHGMNLNTSTPGTVLSLGNVREAVPANMDEF